MAYIGKEPIVGNFQKCDAITVVNGQAAYTLQVSSTNVIPESVNHMLVSLNGILQAPTTSFTVSGATLTFVSNLATGDVIDFVILLGNVLDLGTPSDATVTNAKLGTDLISGETDIGGALADADLVLVDDGAGGTLRKSAMSRVKTYIGGGITVADQWRLTTGFTGDASPIASNLERVDTDGLGTIGSAMSESSGIFTFPSTGVYLVTFHQSKYLDGDDRVCHGNIDTTTDNSSYGTAASSSTFIQQTTSNDTYAASTTSMLFDVTNTTTHKCRFLVVTANQSNTTGGATDTNYTHMTFIRLGDT